MEKPENEAQARFGHSMAAEIDENDNYSYNNESFMYCICFRFNCLITLEPL